MFWEPRATFSEDYRRLYFSVTIVS